MYIFILGNVILGDEKGGLPKQNLCPEILIDTEYRNNDCKGTTHFPASVPISCLR